MKRLFVLILALVMIFSASGEAFAVDGYSEYFSAEREFTVVDNALDYSTYLYSNEETGYLYSRNVDTKEERLIYDKNVTNHYVWNGSIYCVVDGNSIVKITASGSNPETLLTTAKDIDRLYVNNDLIFYQMDNAIYRYYIESGATDCIVEADYIYFFYPYSNFVVEWGTGDGVVYRVDTSAVNSVDSSSASNTTTLDGYTFIKEIKAQAAITATATSVHGVGLPLSRYSHGRYYNKIGRACTCHDSSERCTNIDSNGVGTCYSCEKFNGAAQCMGFAHYIYYQIWGVNVSGINNLYQSLSSSVEARDFLWSISSGTEVRVSGSNTTGHSIIIANVTGNNVTIYHANGSGGCMVEYETMSFAGFVSNYNNIISIYSANDRHSFSSLYSYDGSLHWTPCTTNNCNGKGNLSHHSLVPTSQGKSQCSVCGYVSNTSINTLPGNIG